MKFIDISYWNGTFNFAKAKSKDISGIYCKASQGTNFTDKQFINNKAGWSQIQYRGAYHFVDYWNCANGQEETFGKLQAQYFLKVIKDSGYNLKPAIDFEDNSGSGWGNLKDVKVLQKGLKILLALKNELKAQLGYAPVLYTNYGLVSRKDVSGQFYLRNFSDCPLWLAQYGVSTPSGTGSWSDYAIWQYMVGNDGTQWGNSFGNLYIDMDEVKHIEWVSTQAQTKTETQQVEPEVQPEIQPEVLPEAVEKTDQEKLDILWADYLSREK